MAKMQLQVEIDEEDVELLWEVVSLVTRAREDGKKKYPDRDVWRLEGSAHQMVRAEKHVRAVTVNDPRMKKGEREEEISHAVCRLTMYSILKRGEPDMRGPQPKKPERERVEPQHQVDYEAMGYQPKRGQL